MKEWRKVAFLIYTQVLASLLSSPYFAISSHFIVLFSRDALCKSPSTMNIPPVDQASDNKEPYSKKSLKLSFSLFCKYQDQ
jgi:hypothetical protein